MTRTDVLTRYRKLRQISNEHHHDVLNVVAPDVFRDWAKRLGLTAGKAVLLGSRNEMILAEDLATYIPRPGRTHPLDRFARTARFAPGSDEAIVLEAMCNARFSIWHVERPHETAGLILRDLLRNEETWLLDETMEKHPPLGVHLAGRLLRPEGFAMSARIFVPVTPDLLRQVLDRTPALERSKGDVLAGDPRFATGIYRAAVARGAMNSVRLNQRQEPA
jgi:hypothetical protein